MSLLSDEQITILEGDIEALKMELTNEIEAVKASVAGKLDCSPFYVLSDRLDKTFDDINRIFTDIEIKYNILEQEVNKMRELVDSFAPQVLEYLKHKHNENSIKTE